MSITTTLVQSLLYSQMLTLTILLIPSPKKLKTKIINLTSFRPIKNILYVIYAMVFLMFIDSTLKRFFSNGFNKEYNTNYEKPYTDYHTERNFYLSSFCLYLSLVLKILTTIISKFYKEQETVYYLKKQLNNGQSFVNSVITESGDKNSIIDNYKNEINKLKTIVDKQNVLIKQYENNKNEYLILLDKYNELRNKIKRETKKSK